MMAQQDYLITPCDFAVEAGDDLGAWRLLLGKQAVHRVYGVGTVCQVTGVSPRIRVDVRFDRGEGRPARFGTSAFTDGFFTELNYPLAEASAALARRREERGEEDAQQQRIREAIAEDESRRLMSDIERLMVEARNRERIRLARQAEEERVRMLREQELLARQAKAERAREAASAVRRARMAELLAAARTVRPLDPTALALTSSVVDVLLCVCPGRTPRLHGTNAGLATRSGSGVRDVELL